MVTGECFSTDFEEHALPSVRGRGHGVLLIAEREQGPIVGVLKERASLGGGGADGKETKRRRRSKGKGRHCY